MARNPLKRALQKEISLHKEFDQTQIRVSYLETEGLDALLRHLRGDRIGVLSSLVLGLQFSKPYIISKACRKSLSSAAAAVISVFRPTGC